MLEGLEAVRKRPGMYIGSTGARGLHHLVYEVVDNSVDEAIAGYCGAVKVVLHPDNSCTVSDDGRGIPVDQHAKEKRPAAEVVLTTLHAGGKFGDGGGYKVSGGLHGVGVSVVNALSERLYLEISRDGFVWTQEYERGKPKADFKKGPTTKQTGTTITFLPDLEVFEEFSFDFETLAERLRETAFLTRGLKIELVDERGETREVSFQYDGGIQDFVKHLNENKDELHRKAVYFEGENDDGQVEVAMQWNTSYQESLFSFANNINTHEGGTHLSGFRSALTRTLNAYARGKGLLKEKDENLAGEDVREGLTAVISVKLHDPQFEGQTKTKLGNPPIEGLVKEAVNRKLGEFFEENPGDARRIITKAIEASRARDAARKARDLTRRKSALENSTLPGKLADCTVKDPRPRGAFHRRRRLRGRLRQAGTRPQHAGGAATARQDHQRREEPHRQSSGQHRDPGADHGDRHRRARRIQPRGGPLPQGCPDDRRRCRRRPHPHPGADLPLSPDAGALRRRLRLHRQAAALWGQERQQDDLRRARVRARGAAAARQARGLRARRRQRASKKLTRSRWQSYVRRSKEYEGWGSSLQAEFGHDLVHFLEESQLLDQEVATLAGARKVIAAKEPRRSPTRPSS